MRRIEQIRNSALDEDLLRIHYDGEVNEETLSALYKRVKGHQVSEEEDCVEDTVVYGVVILLLGNDLTPEFILEEIAEKGGRLVGEEEVPFLQRLLEFNVNFRA